MCQYVDNLKLSSLTFKKHLIHLDLVLNKLTSAGFNINTAKCKLCKSQIKFLGQIISTYRPSADSQQIEAIVCYPAPRNQRQLNKIPRGKKFSQVFHNKPCTLHGTFTAITAEGRETTLVWTHAAGRRITCNRFVQQFAYISRGCPIPYGMPRHITKCVKLYLLSRAISNSCLNKLRNHYFIHIIKPYMIL